MMYPLIATLILLLAAQRVTIKVDPLAIGPGGNAWVTCRVPRNEINRKVRMGIPNHRMTEFQIDGDNAPAMFTFLVREIPCLPELEALCILETNNPKDTVIVHQRLLMASCE